jgi:hypothetical protein
MSRTVKNTSPYIVELPTLGLWVDPGATVEVPDDAECPPFLSDVKTKSAAKE